MPDCAAPGPRSQFSSFLRYVLVCYRLPVCSLRVLFIVERTATTHGWNFQEIVGFRRRFGIPFQGKCIPRISAGRLTATKRDNEVPEEYQDSYTEHKGANRCYKVQFIPAKITGIRVDATWHTKQSHNMHWEEGKIHTYQH